MKVRIHSTTMASLDNLDTLDYAVLKTVCDHESPVWKTKVYNYITENEKDFPVLDSISQQTIGRRMDRLLSEEYLTNEIVEPDSVPRGMLIAYDVTEDGREALQEKRRALLKRAVKHSIFPEEEGSGLDKHSLITLMQDEYEFGDDRKEQFQDYDYTELVTFLTIRYARKNATDTLDSGHMDKYEQVLDDHPELLEALGLDSVKVTTPREK